MNKNVLITVATCVCSIAITAAWMNASRPRPESTLTVAQLSTLASDMKSQSGKLDTMTEQLAALEAGLKSNMGKVTDLESPLKGQGQKIDTIAGRLETTQATINKLEAKLAEGGQDAADLAPIVLKRAADVDAHVKPLLEANDIRGFAHALAEADEWLFDPAEEEMAFAALQRQMQILRVWVQESVKRSLELALAAEKGSIAAGFLKDANSSFGLYPQPNDEAGAKDLDKIVASISDTSRRVDELRRLRYNQWAIRRIQDGVRQFHENKNVGPEAVVAACVTSLAYIDPAHLDPTVMDLYQYLVQISREKAGDGYFSRIARGLTDPKVSRLTPFDFDK